MQSKSATLAGAAQYGGIHRRARRLRHDFRQDGGPGRVSRLVHDGLGDGRIPSWVPDAGIATYTDMVSREARRRQDTDRWPMPIPDMAGL